MRSTVLLLSLVLLGCPSQVTNPAGGNGGGGSGGGSGGGAEGGGGGGPGPCVSAADCAALTDSCNTGTCINGACEKAPANEGTACDDGKQCTVGDSCQDGACTSGN